MWLVSEKLDQSAGSLNHVIKIFTAFLMANRRPTKLHHCSGQDEYNNEKNSNNIKNSLCYKEIKTALSVVMQEGF